MKKILMIASIMMSLLLLVACTKENSFHNTDNLRITTISHDWQFHPTTDYLIERATDIVRVEFLDERVELIDPAIPHASDALFDCPPEREHVPRYFVFTVNHAKVTEVFKGSAQVGDIIEINQMGGQLESEKLVCRDLVVFERSDDFVVFLRSWGAAGHERENAYSLLGPLQSIYRLPSHDGGISAFSFNEELESINDDESFRLPLTMGDLLQVAEANFGTGAIQSFSVYFDNTDMLELDSEYGEDFEYEYLEESDEQ